VHGNLVYVLNARDGGSIQGYLRLGRSLVKVAGWHRALGLDPSATARVSRTRPARSRSTPDGNRLVVTTKAGSNAVDVFGVDRLARAPSATPGREHRARGGAVRGHLRPRPATWSSPRRVRAPSARSRSNRDNTLSQLSTVATGPGGDLLGSSASAAPSTPETPAAENLSGYRVAAGGAR